MVSSVPTKKLSDRMGRYEQLIVIISDVSCRPKSKKRSFMQLTSVFYSSLMEKSLFYPKISYLWTKNTFFILFSSKHKSIYFISTVLQGWTKVWFPGSVNMRRKSYVFLPAAGRRKQFFHLIFTEPGNHTLAHPCILSPNFLHMVLICLPAMNF